MSERVLLVDDDEDAVEVLSLILTDLGYTVRSAGDGRAALAISNEFAPEVAIVDIGLPDMDGYELGRRLRECDAEMQLIALTGYGRTSDRERSRRAGFSAHFLKPVHLDQLQAALSSQSGTVASPAH